MSQGKSVRDFLYLLLYEVLVDSLLGLGSHDIGISDYTAVVKHLMST
jgi:hypothetical protein